LEKEKPDKIKPCIVQTPQGFTISYKEKFLYSKYNPSKAILQYIEKLELQAQTIFLCISPVLPYGLKELSQKLPADCIMLGCELDKELKTFIDLHEEDYRDIKNFSFLTKDEIFNLGPILTKKNYSLSSGFKLPPAGSFRRIIRIDFSAGAAFAADIYESLYQNAVNALMTFWANRVTLVKFGRRYCSHFFKNLKLLDKTLPIKNYIGKISKAILVIGAGESAEKGIELVKKTDRNKLFIICVDTALQPLMAQGITPDGVFIEEAQNIIAKCFTGTQDSSTQIFAGLSALSSLNHIFDASRISYFTTLFTQAEFIEKLAKEDLLPPQNEPFGSVGITALYYALLFRSSNSIPVFICGLDFSYSAGRTHTKGAMADNSIFATSTRLSDRGNFSASYNSPAFKVKDKNGREVYTTPIMTRYAQLLSTYFAGTINLFDLSNGGIELGINKPSEEDLKKIDIENSSRDFSKGPLYDSNISSKLKAYFAKEISELQELKAILTGEKKLKPQEQEKSIRELIADKEYLYLHFADGQSFNYSQSFLNRIRVEIDYFLKIMS